MAAMSLTNVFDSDFFAFIAKLLLIAAKTVLNGRLVGYRSKDDAYEAGLCPPSGTLTSTEP